MVINVIGFVTGNELSYTDSAATRTQTPRQPDPSATDDAPAESDATALAKDDAYHLLQSSRRRAVLRYLLSFDEKERFRMRDVAEAVAA